MEEQKIHHIEMLVSEWIPQDENPCWGYTIFVQGLPSQIRIEHLVEMGSCTGSVIEVCHILADRTAYIRFSKVDDAIKFFELGNKQPIPSSCPGIKPSKPVMSPGSDYPCLKVVGLPRNTTKESLLASIERQAPKFDQPQVLLISEDEAVVKYKTKRVAKKMFSYSRKLPLFFGGKKLTFDWEGTPAARVVLPWGFQNKEKICKAFDVLGENHVIGVAISKEIAFVYFDYRFNLEKAKSIIGDTVKIEKDDGSICVCKYFLFE